MRFIELLNEYVPVNFNYVPLDEPRAQILHGRLNLFVKQKVYLWPY